MIEVYFYKNGVELKGHAIQHICSEISILTWACANTVYKVDETSLYYASVVDNKLDGYSCFEFDTTNEKANWIFEDYKHNVRTWGKDMWKETDVKITELDELFIYPFNQEVNESMFIQA